MNPYITAGPDIPAMLGRDRLCERVVNRLLKPNGDQVSIVGPKRYGKTVLLNHLDGQFRQRKGDYIASMLIDLRHHTPETDAEVRQLLADRVRHCLLSSHSDLAAELAKAKPESLFDILQIVVESLADQKHKLLVIFDSFDALPIGTSITTNLLGQLRELARQPSFSIVIASRKRLRELCKTEASRGSDFWRIFGEPIVLGAFDDADYDALWAPFGTRGIQVEPGARTELKNWTGGIPVLVTTVLGGLYDAVANGTTLAANDVIDSAKSLAVDCADTVGDIWDDCDPELRTLLTESVGRELGEGEMPPLQRRDAELRGFAKVSAGKVQIASRIIADYARQQSSSVQDMTRLFGTEVSFNRNIRRVLELRLAVVPTVDNALTQYVRHAIRDLPDEQPNHVLDTARGIVEEALRVIWCAEKLDTQTRFPQAWQDTWKNNRGLTLPAGMDPLPTDRGEQLRVVRHIAGSTKDYSRVATVVSRHTVMLLEQLGSIGNFRAHTHGEGGRYGAACAMCFTAIELLASLAADLGRPAAVTSAPATSGG